MIKRLCLVIPSLQPGGMERVMSELSGYFCNQEGLDVHLILYGRKPVIFFSIPPNLKVHQPVSKFHDCIRFFSAINRLVYLRRTVIRLRPDSVLSFGEYWNSFVLIALFGLQFPVFVSDRCSPEKRLGRLHEILRKCLYPRAKGIIAQTNSAMDFYRKSIKHDNVGVIGNPIREVQTANYVEKKKIVLTVGRLIRSKNHDKLIKVFCRLNIKEWMLIIVGGDAQKQNNMSRLKKIINEYQAHSKVIVTGNQNDTDAYYKQSLIFAFTSESEGFPNVIGEAMSAGLPVIAFNCVAGPSEMITDGIDGYLVEPGDYSTFSSRLKDLMTNDSRRDEFGAAARKAIKRYSLENIGRLYLDFISKE